jgi:transposase
MKIQKIQKKLTSKERRYLFIKKLNQGMTKEQAFEEVRKIEEAVNKNKERKKVKKDFNKSFKKLKNDILPYPKG